jgi:hypothetical protein
MGSSTRLVAPAYHDQARIGIRLSGELKGDQRALSVFQPGPTRKEGKKGEWPFTAGDCCPAQIENPFAYKIWDHLDRRFDEEPAFEVPGGVV